MTISGILNLGFPAAHPITPTNSAFVAGDDGKHYIISGDQFTSVAYIGQAEDKSVVTIDETQWRADLTSTGVIDGITHDFFMLPVIIPCPTTPYFYVLGTQPPYPYSSSDTALPAGEFYMVGVRYKIDSGGNIVVDGGFLRRSAHAGAGRPLWGYVFGAIVKDSFVYALVGCVLLPAAAYLFKLPLSGATADATLGSWTAHITRLPTALANQTLFYFANAQNSNSNNNAGILPLANGQFRIFSYLGWGARLHQPTTTWYLIDTTGSEYWDVDPEGHTASTMPQDGRSFFNQPWSDSKTKHDGTESTNVADEYSAPNIQAIDGGYEITFGRAFSDELSTVRFKRFFYNTGSGLISFVDILEKTVSAVTGSSGVFQTAMMYRESDNDVIYAINDIALWGFGEDVESPPSPPEPGEGGDDLVQNICPPPTTTVRQLKPFPKPPINRYRVGHERSIFPVTFVVMAKAGLRVTIDGIELDQTDFSFAGNACPIPGYRGGLLELDDPVKDCIVEVWNDPAPARETDFAFGEIENVTLNTAFETLWIGARAQSLRVERSPTLAFSGSHVLTAAESGETFAGVMVTLPGASPGLHYDLIGGSAARAGSDSIKDGASSGTSITAASSTATLHLICPKAGLWFVVSKNGTWTLT
jgi:hypothetical protein